MKKLILTVIANALGLYLATAVVPGVSIPLDLKNFAVVVLVLTAINLMVKPIVKLLFMPILIITLGLGSLIVNALMLYILDFIMSAVTIEGLVALFVTTLILSATNLVIHIIGKTIKS